MTEIKNPILAIFPGMPVFVTFVWLTLSSPYSFISSSKFCFLNLWPCFHFSGMSNYPSAVLFSFTILISVHSNYILTSFFTSLNISLVIKPSLQMSSKPKHLTQLLSNDHVYFKIKKKMITEWVILDSHWRRNPWESTHAW
jgi:hypothetical protein